MTSTVAAAIVNSGKYPNLEITGTAPYEDDYVALIAQRQEQGLLNYLNLFISHQVRTGRYQELYKKWVGAGPAPGSREYPQAYAGVCLVARRRLTRA